MNSTNQIAGAFGQQYIKKEGIYHFGLRCGNIYFRKKEIYILVLGLARYVQACKICTKLQGVP